MNRRGINQLGGLLLGGASIHWTTPIVKTLLLPAHAQTSCVLLPQATPPLPGVSVHSIGDASITIGDIKQVHADISFNSSSLVLLLLLDSGTTLTMAPAAISCAGVIAPIEVASSANHYAVGGTIRKVNGGEYLVETSITISGGLSVTASALIRTFVQVVGP